MKRLMLTSGLVVSLGLSAYAADLYVDVTATKGGDGSAQAPFATIQAAAAGAGASLPTIQADREDRAWAAMVPALGSRRPTASPAPAAVAARGVARAAPAS